MWTARGKTKPPVATHTRISLRVTLFAYTTTFALKISIRTQKRDYAHYGHNLARALWQDAHISKFLIIS